MGFDRNKFKDPDYKGEDFNMPKHLDDGPCKERKCTDILFLIIFILFLGAMIGCSAYGYQKGSPGKLFAPLDSDGNICGYDPDYIEYNHMYIWDIVAASKDPKTLFNSAVCVKQCPNEQKQGKFVIECKETNYLKNKKKTCSEVPTEYDTKTCNSWYPNSNYIDISNYCIPVSNDLPQEVKDNIANIIDAITSDQFGNQIADLGVSAKVIAICAFVSLILAGLYLFTLKYFAKIVAWLSIFIILGSLIGIGAYMFVISKDYPSSSNLKNGLKFAAGGVWLVALLYVIAILCLRKSLQISLAVLEAASDFVGSNLRIILIPILFFILNIIVFSCWIAGIVLVFSIGDIDNGPAGSQYKTVKWNQNTRNMIYFMIFGILWLISFMIACSQFIIIVASSTWYFSHGSDTQGNSQISAGFKWIFRYHTGSLALGSFIIAVIWGIKLIFEFITNKMRQAGANRSVVLRCMICCVKCCIDCVDRFVKFINRNAYIQIALTSENFCTSAMNSFILMLKHAGKFTLVSGIGNIFIILGKMTIASLTTLIGFLIMENWVEIKEALDSPLIPLLVIFMISYVVAAVFVSVFATTSNTILQCFLVDLDISQQEGREGGKHRPPALESFVYLAKKDNHFQNDSSTKKLL